MKDLDTELKEQLNIEVSDVLNDTGAYNKILEIIEEKTGITHHNDSMVFSEIEQAIVELLT